jgi:ribonuclease HI
VHQAQFLTDSPTTVTVYTDGGCDPNPGAGGWGALLLFSGHDVELCGNAPQTTNNQMELEAAVAALAYLDGRYERCQIELHTDSQYLRQGITQWIDDWFARGWKTKNGQTVKNQDLWRRLYELTHAHQVRWHWVKGHAGDPNNERVDYLATQARLRLAGDHDTASPSSPARSEHAELSIGVSCQGSKGVGGWAVVLRTGEQRRILQGREEQTTSNSLALRAATEGLCALGSPRTVTAYATSDYLCKGASQWVRGWRQNGWRTRSGDPVQNHAQWEALLQAAEPHQVTWQLVKSKNLTDDLTEAKRLATQEAKRD